MTREEEAEAIARANRGDAGALTDLYRAHRDWVAALAYRFTGSAEDARDVAQETFLYLFGRFPLRLTVSLRGFLYPVVKHQAISTARRRKPQAPLSEDLAWHDPGGQGDFTRLLDLLPVEQREVVRLRFGLDFALDEIAEALGVPLGTVKSRLHHALKSLAAKIE